MLLYLKQTIIHIVLTSDVYWKLILQWNWISSNILWFAEKNMKRSFIPHFRIILLIYLRGCFPFWECEFRNYLLKFKRKANFVGVFSAKKMFAIKLNFNPNILSVQAKTFDEIFFNMRAIQREFEENFRSEYFGLWTWFVCVWIQHCRATKKQFRQMKPKTWFNGNVLLLISSFK